MITSGHINTDALDKLISERDSLRAIEKQLTEKIKIERSRISAERKKLSEKEKEIRLSADDYHSLKRQNRELKSMCALLLRDYGLTYGVIGEKLGCSNERAREIIVKECRRINHGVALKQKECEE